jgi:CubicO group peptidase (beta-lactamase class C family)
VSPKRNDRVAPPPEPGGWDFRFANNRAAGGSEALCRQAPTNARRAYEAITNDPAPPAWSGRQHRMEHALAEREFKGRLLPQWQYEVTGGGRVWYLVDDERRLVWLWYAGTGHPKETE